MFKVLDQLAQGASTCKATLADGAVQVLSSTKLRCVTEGYSWFIWYKASVMTATMAISEKGSPCGNEQLTCA